MAQLKVDSITNKTDSGAPELTLGATVPSGQTISGSGGMVVNGTVQATTFVGNGSGLAAFTSPSKAWAIKLITYSFRA
jgi:hypothetical protein